TLILSEIAYWANTPAARLGLSVISDELTSRPNFHLLEAKGSPVRLSDWIPDSLFQAEGTLLSLRMAGSDGWTNSPRVIPGDRISSTRAARGAACANGKAAEAVVGDISASGTFVAETGSASGLTGCGVVAPSAIVRIGVVGRSGAASWPLSYFQYAGICSNAASRIAAAVPYFHRTVGVFRPFGSAWRRRGPYCCSKFSQRPSS